MPLRFYNSFRHAGARALPNAFAAPKRVVSRVVVKIEGDWILQNTRTEFKDFLADLGDEPFQTMSFDAEKLGCFDSSFISFLLRVYDYCSARECVFDLESVPEKPRALLKLAVAVPAKKSGSDIFIRKGVYENVRDFALKRHEKFKDHFGFFGELVLGCLRLISGAARIRKGDMLYEVQRAGPDALGIVGLISFLVGLILAFVGANILVQYGSEIFVADLVGLAMVREMGVIMVAIVMAGRTGAAYAAELGSMKINEEIAAFRTFGISPLEFLVLPRIIALILMFPLLTIFADIIGMLGGFAIGYSMFDINYDAYMNRTFASLTLTHCATGVLKSAVFGIIVAVVGCMKGMTCGDNAQAVGNATTSSVVTSITLIIIADAVFSVIFNIFNI